MFNINCINSLGEIAISGHAATIAEALEMLASKMETLQAQPNLKIEIVFGPDEDEKGN